MFTRIRKVQIHTVAWLIAFYQNQVGAQGSGASQALGAIILGVLALVFGTILADVVIDTATTALTNASIGSFAGASAIGGLIPFIYFTVVIMIGVGMIAVGGLLAKKVMTI